MLSSQRRQRQILAVLHILYTNHNIISGDAQLLSAYEQVYGPWNIKLTKNVFARRRWHLDTFDRDEVDVVKRRKESRRVEKDGDLQILFPEARREKSKPLDEREKPSNEQVNGPTKSVPVRSVSCMLNLEKNGRFSLFVDQEGCFHDVHEKPNSTNHDSACLAAQKHPTSLIHQPLKGEWYLTPNPYCVTDRHFDTILLVSEPRMRRRRFSTTEKATIELRCKLWGRYGVGAIRKKFGLKHGRMQGRITHGTVTIHRERIKMGTSGKKMLPTREIVGTFCGRRKVDFNPLERGKAKVPDHLRDDEHEDDYADNFGEFDMLQNSAAQ